MLATFVLLLVLWASGVIFSVGGNAIHLLFVTAILLLVRAVVHGFRGTDREQKNWIEAGPLVADLVRRGNSASSGGIERHKVIV
jgi:hypothetical protein